MSGVKIAPSILAADQADLRGEVLKVEEAGADLIHVDVTDGHFAPNISMGPDTVRSIRRVTKLPLDVHLMISDPGKFVEPFLSAGSDILTVHAETVNLGEVDKLSLLIRSQGRKFGIALKPQTAIPSWLENEPEKADLLLVLSVNPGFPGQSFMPEVLPKVRAAAKISSSTGLEVEVDGGVEQRNAFEIVRAGATILVAGASIFRQPNPGTALRQIRGEADNTARKVAV